MSATSAATFVKKSVGWSIGLSVLMIVAGILRSLHPWLPESPSTCWSLGCSFSAGASIWCLPGTREGREASLGVASSGFSTFSSACICSCIRWRV